jgi:glycosyltransferase involved in cell wall biosynthesis
VSFSSGPDANRQSTAVRRVLFVFNSTKIGGGAKVLMDLTTRLDRQRYVPAIVSPGPGPLADWAESQRIPLYTCPEGDWASRTGLMRRSLQLLRINAQVRPHIVHAAAPMCYRALGLASRLSNIIRVCHLGFPPEPGELERAFLSGPEAVIGCYEGQAAEHASSIQRLSPDCRVVGIPNGIDIDRFSPTGATGEDPAAWRFGARHVVAILGHVSAVKGYSVFVQAAARIRAANPDVAFVAVGTDSTEPGYQRKMELEAGRLGIADCLHFVGFQREVAPILRAADVVTLPSFAEGFPLAVLEAMACGKPVVATPVGGVQEAILHGKTGVLVPVDSPEALASEVADLLLNSDRARQLGTNARCRAEEHFSATRFANRIQELYFELLSARHAKHLHRRHAAAL